MITCKLQLHRIDVYRVFGCVGLEKVNNLYMLFGCADPLGF